MMYLITVLSINAYWEKCLYLRHSCSVFTSRIIITELSQYYHSCFITEYSNNHLFCDNTVYNYMRDIRYYLLPRFL
jgi:hypothetical protein